MDAPEAYTNLDLYEVLKVDRTESAQNIRKAYLRRALECHPDKGGDAETFQQVSFAYSVLSDASKRAQYDETGSLDFRGAEIADLFSRACRAEITPEMIEEHKLAYQNSEEERADVLRAYKKHKGDFDLVLENVIHSTEDDSDRLIALIREAVEKGEVEEFKKFKKTTQKQHRSKQLKKASKEAKEVEQSRKELGIESEAGLAALIQSRQKQRFGGVIERLEQKYGVKKDTKKPRKSSKK